MSSPKLDREQAYKIELDGVEYDVRKLTEINPLDSSDYWEADYIELVFKDGAEVSVYKSDLLPEKENLLDSWVDPT